MVNSIILNLKLIKYQKLSGHLRTSYGFHEIAKITAFAEKSGYNKLEDRYDNPMIMDIPAAISTINRKTVFNRYEGPDLKDLYTRIEQLISTVNWKAKNNSE